MAFTDPDFIKNKISYKKLIKQNKNIQNKINNQFKRTPCIHIYGSTDYISTRLHIYICRFVEISYPQRHKSNIPYNLCFSSRNNHYLKLSNINYIFNLIEIILK